MKFNNKIIIILYSILHLCVDGICIYAIFHSLYDTEVSSQRTLWVFLIYNGLAFLLQPIIGVFIDKYKNHKIFLIISIALLGLGLVTNKIYYNSQNNSYLTLKLWLPSNKLLDTNKAYILFPIFLSILSFVHIHIGCISST